MWPACVRARIAWHARGEFPPALSPATRPIARPAARGTPATWSAHAGGSRSGCRAAVRPCASAAARSRAGSARAAAHGHRGCFGAVLELVTSATPSANSRSSRRPSSIASPMSLTKNSSSTSTRRVRAPFAGDLRQRIAFAGVLRKAACTSRMKRWKCVRRFSGSAGRRRTGRSGRSCRGRRRPTGTGHAGSSTFLPNSESSIRAWTGCTSSGMQAIEFAQRGVLRAVVVPVAARHALRVALRGQERRRFIHRRSGLRPASGSTSSRPLPAMAVTSSPHAATGECGR